MVKTYNKLVRDGIPEIIKKKGEIPQTKILDKKEFFKKIKKKILEEANELVKAKGNKNILEEIADIQELIDVLTKEMNITWLRLRKLQVEKKEKRGGFEKRLFLIKTETRPRA